MGSPSSTMGTSVVMGLSTSTDRKSTWRTSRRTGWRCISFTTASVRVPSMSRVMRALRPLSVVRADRSSRQSTVMARGSAPRP